MFKKLSAIGLIISMLAIIAMVIALFYIRRQSYVIIDSEPTSPSQPQAAQNPYTTYTNSVLGISFQYPTELGEVQVDYQEGKPDTVVTAGKKATLWFKSNEKHSFNPYITAKTPDFRGYYETDGTNYTQVDQFCTSGDSSVASIARFCETVTLGKNNFAWVNEFSTPECSPSFVIEAHLINPNNTYRDVQIAFQPRDIYDLILDQFDCEYSESEITEKVVPVIRKVSDDIFGSQQTLSATDTADIEKFEALLQSITLTNTSQGQL